MGENIMVVREVEVSVRFSRTVSLAYQTWLFSTGLAEKVRISSDEELVKARKRLRLRCMGAVYRDATDDFDRIANVVNGHPSGASMESQLLAFKAEAEEGYQDAKRQLDELNGGNEND